MRSPITYYLFVQPVAAGCGNRIVESPEECDDGNMISGDGCSSMCRQEIAMRIRPPGGMVTLNVPPFGSRQLVEVELTSNGQSIAASTSNGSGTCTTNTAMGLFFGNIPLGFKLTGGTDPCAAIDPVSDAFSADLEQRIYVLSVENETMTAGQTILDVRISDPGCGNRIVNASSAEQCDDGNMSSGDGCSQTCQFESGVTVESEPNGDGASADDSTLRAAGMVTVAGVLRPAPDQDFFRLTVPSGRPMSLVAQSYANLGNRNSCAGDTRLRLFDASLRQIAVDDNGGHQGCSKIDGTATATGAMSLTPGMYFVEIEPYFPGQEISRYLLDLELR
jgi:cysteine-rich repeat protein